MLLRKHLAFLAIIIVSLGCITSQPALLTATPRPTQPVAPTPAATSTHPTEASPTRPATSPTAAIPDPTTPTATTAEILEQLGGYPCPDSDFTCINLTVPLDHFDAANEATIEVVFGVLPAAGRSKGMFVTATGGPGTSGLMDADPYTAAMDSSITDHFDIVFFDQRGVGLSGGMQCPQAAATYYQAAWDATTPEGESVIIESSQTFAEDCVSEMGSEAAKLLPYMGTRQAIEDLEAFRELIGDSEFWLYGESYGTQYAQAYAAAYPEHLAGLILDGTVDLTLSGTDFLTGQAQAFNDVLEMTLQACNEDEFCADDFGVDALEAYDDLAARLAEAPIAFTFPLPSGGAAEREFTFSDLETAASSYLYSESARQILLRALASATRDDDMIPLARVLYDSLVLDPETLEAIPDPSFSDAVYYAVECQDYAYFSGTPTEKAEAYLRAGDAIDASLKRFASVFYGDIACAFWPDAPTDLERPAPLTADGIPTLVLGATADPATPVSNGQRVFSHLADGYLITMEGGPHVTYGWGNACPDDLVTAFLVDETPPDERESTCDGVVADEYYSIPPLSAEDFADPLEAMVSVDDAIYYLPEYFYWDLDTPTSVGCPFGGVLTFEPTDTGEAFTIEGCAFSEGFVMSGDGTYNYDTGEFSLQVTVSGLAEGTLTYTRQDDGSVNVTGEYDGKPVDLDG